MKLAFKSVGLSGVPSPMQVHSKASRERIYAFFLSPSFLPSLSVFLSLLLFLCVCLSVPLSVSLTHTSCHFSFCRDPDSHIPLCLMRPHWSVSPTAPALALAVALDS